MCSLAELGGGESLYNYPLKDIFLCISLFLACVKKNLYSSQTPHVVCAFLSCGLSLLLELSSLLPAAQFVVFVVSVLVP